MFPKSYIFSNAIFTLSSFSILFLTSSYFLTILGSILFTKNNLHPNGVFSGPIILFGSALKIISDTSLGKFLYSIKPSLASSGFCFVFFFMIFINSSERLDSLFNLFISSAIVITSFLS